MKNMKKEIDPSLLEVSYKDKHIILNEFLLKKQGIYNEDSIYKIAKLHYEKMRILDEMENTHPTEILKLHIFGQKLKDIEFELQKAWGFELNEKFHKFWYQPHCTCPKIDNDERFTYDCGFIDEECPVHGKANKVQKVIDDIPGYRLKLYYNTYYLNKFNRKELMFDVKWTFKSFFQDIINKLKI
jgi:hypothetical protein